MLCFWRSCLTISHFSGWLSFTHSGSPHCLWSSIKFGIQNQNIWISLPFSRQLYPLEQFFILSKFHLHILSLIHGKVKLNIPIPEFVEINWSEGEAKPGSCLYEPALMNDQSAKDWWDHTQSFHGCCPGTPADSREFCCLLWENWLLEVLKASPSGASLLAASCWTGPVLILSPRKASVTWLSPCLDKLQKVSAVKAG